MDENKKIQITIDDENYETFSTPAFDRKKKWEMPDDNIIKSIIPGTIIDVMVKQGQTVKEGDIMLVIEAMKMNNRLAFTKDGVVDKIFVKPGDIVAKGKELLSLK
ncbi:MAG: acetyl-CoA carboxylase biotin carboxyl carrier protein subunit [Bacteroidales bacterium]|nr:acetyl-CoA carboxylase biotin carboxyl carrier protein subunit [Bacteroidales bacterium]